MGEIIEELKRVAPRGFAKTGLKLDNYIDNVEEFWRVNPFFYDKTQMFWLWNKDAHRYELTDETDMMNLIDAELGFGGQTVTAKIRGNYLEAFKRVGRQHIPPPSPKTWIQFKNKIVDIKSQTIIEASPDYFITNPIPWTLADTDDTPETDKLFKDWQGDNSKTLYEILAYCLLPDYPIHIIIANIGTGRNGKSQYTKIIERFIGKENTTSAELDSLIKERFESAKLHKKLVCLMGETNFGTMTQTSLLKKLCGGDLISYEYKNKMPFTDVNYAKIIINTNSLPATSDTTDGFFRRWLILNWHNNFEESGKDVFERIPLEEYPCLARKCLNRLVSLLHRGRFLQQGSIDDRKERYILASNPLSIFLKERCEQGDSYYVKAKDLYHAYITYLQEKKRRIIKRKEFNQLIAEEGFQAEHCERKTEVEGMISYQNSFWVDGLRLKNFPPFPPISALVLTSVAHREGKEVEAKAERAELSLNAFSEKAEKDSYNFDELISLIIDRVPQEIYIDTLISYGFNETDLEKWKTEGLIYEPKQGLIRLI